MNATKYHDPEKMQTEFTFTLSDVEFQSLQLYEFDKAALNTPLGEGAWIVSNILLDLQLIAMRLAQQADGSEE